MTIHSEGDRRINWSRVPIVTINAGNISLGEFDGTLDKYVDIYINGKWEPYSKGVFKGRVKR